MSSKLINQKIQYKKMFILGFYTRPQIPDNKVGCGKCGYGKKNFSFKII